ncbi:uridine kinase [Marinomonas atlantica]|uniref:uridine kinase n=1 Tax=Marinomonas atlantica TaxID=1806668 RepID=UPI000A49EF30|nr:uridine kinase [Marinomonas atlantica]MCO4785558.1 uridine kinase [Marinomonas atlantica]
MYLNTLALKGFCTTVFMLVSFTSVAEDLVQTDSTEVVGEVTPAAPSYSKGAELFGVEFNDLSKAKFEAHLSKMGLEQYPSYREGMASYSLGTTGILGIKELTVVYNRYEYVERATMSGVVEDAELRSKLGSLLERKYGPPSIGFIRDGYGRARWMLVDGTEIELHNTTFDVSVSYVDRVPKRKSASGRIDVEALLKRNQ